MLSRLSIFNDAAKVFVLPLVLAAMLLLPAVQVLASSSAVSMDRDDRHEEHERHERHERAERYRSRGYYDSYPGYYSYGDTTYRNRHHHRRYRHRDYDRDDYYRR